MSHPGPRMAFRVVRLRREARRNAKLEEIFQVGRRVQKGKIFLKIKTVHKSA